jgi:methylated-DNA-[protein]-cysteine S-methyltransferase
MKENLQFISTLGPVTITSTGDKLTQVSLYEILPAPVDGHTTSALLLNARNQILQYLAGSRVEFDLPLDWDRLNGFKKDVLEITTRIPYGQVLTYGQIAKTLGKPGASRAVGAALGANPFLFIIPCHRVVASDGTLSGFAAPDGIMTKKKLLELEGHKIVGKKLG